MTSTQTSNFGLVKPTPNTAEPVNVLTQLDNNWDTIDQYMNLITVQVFTATGVWNKPTGCKRVRVKVQGGGASSGGVASTSAGQIAMSGGGGGGGYAEKFFQASSLASSETVTVGTGGAAAASGGAGVNGGTSSFATGKGYVVTANGGVATAAGAAGSGTGNISGGLGGAASGGDLNIRGGDGGNAVFVSSFALASAMGGGSIMSSPSNQNASNGIPSGVTKYGGGTAGTFNGASASAKGSVAAGDGVVVVEMYY